MDGSGLDGGIPLYFSPSNWWERAYTPYFSLSNFCICFVVVVVLSSDAKKIHPRHLNFFLFFGGGGGAWALSLWHMHTTSWLEFSPHPLHFLDLPLLVGLKIFYVQLSTALYYLYVKSWILFSPFLEKFLSFCWGGGGSAGFNRGCGGKFSFL